MKSRIFRSLPSVFPSLFERLRAAGYHNGALQQTLNAASLDDVGILNHAPATVRARACDSPAAALIRLFFLELSEPTRSLRRVFAHRELTTLLDVGLLAKSKGRDELAARLRIDPVDEQYFVADLRFRAPARRALELPAGDQVYPVSSDSLLLARCVPKSSGARVLDLCTGSGAQAIRLATAASAVTAVDCNPRAIGIAELNAALNGSANVTIAEGDLYGGVARTDTFDTIVANPPFVSSPYDDAPSFHAGGARGDRILKRVIAGWGKHLADGGRALAIAHVGLRDENELTAIAQRWFAGFPGRAAVVAVEYGSAVDLAAAQSLFALHDGTRAYAREVELWSAYLHRHRIATIAVILVIAERRSPAGVEVIDARPRILPLPFSAPPEQRVDSWFAAKVVS